MLTSTLVIRPASSFRLVPRCACAGTSHGTVTLQRRPTVSPRFERDAVGRAIPPLDIERSCVGGRSRMRTSSAFDCEATPERRCRKCEMLEAC